MSGQDFDIDALRKAFARRDGAGRADSAPPREVREAGEALQPPEPEVIWDAVRGQLDREERLELLDRATDDPQLALEWRLARELHAETQERALEAPSQGLRRWRSLAAIAASFMLVALVAVFFVLPAGDDDPVFRQPAELSIESELPVEGTLSAARPILSWTLIEGATYQVSMLRPDTLVEVFHASDLAQPRVEVPPSIWAELPADGVLLWRVEARLPTGERVRSETFRVSFLDLE